MTEETIDSNLSDYDETEFRITFPEFVDYLTAVNMKLKCNECDSDQGWSCDTTGQKFNDGDILSVYRMPSAQGATFRAYYAMSCLNCGVIRHLSAKPVLVKIEAERAKKNGE